MKNRASRLKIEVRTLPQVDVGWMDDAACKGMDTEAWFPTNGGMWWPTPAFKVCASCPVKDQCLEYALVTRQNFGIWGGESERGRDRIRRQRRKKAS